MENGVCKGFDHLSIVVKDIKKSEKFYDKLLNFFGFEKITSEEDCHGWSNGPNGFWINQVGDSYKNKDFHRKNVGLNHIAFRAISREVVDKFYREFLLPNKIPVLYRKPKEYPEYHQGYYAVFFEDPDCIKLELMWMPE
ncbi:MAG: VOC family protein [Nanoarchaeota archaeon]